MLIKTFLTTLCITAIGTNIGSAYEGHWKPLEPVSVKNKIQFFQNLAQSQIQEITPVKT